MCLMSIIYNKSTFYLLHMLLVHHLHILGTDCTAVEGEELGLAGLKLRLGMVDGGDDDGLEVERHAIGDNCRHLEALEEAGSCLPQCLCDGL